MSFNSSKLSNGLKIVTYFMPQISSVAINLSVNVGSRYENENEAGISHFLEHMAFKGTENRSAKVIAEEFDIMGGNFNAFTSRERTVYHCKILKNNFAKALDIIADIIQNSVFNEEDIEKEYNVILQEIAGTFDDPDDLVHEKLYETIFPNQAIGKSILGVKESLINFKKESFENFLDKYYSANNMCLSIAGNISHEEVVKQAENLFSNLSNKIIPEYLPAIYHGGSQIIPKDLEQLAFRMSFKAYSYLNIREYYISQLLSIILGGGISSRLFQQIREKLGLVYSIGCYSAAYADNGILTIYAACNQSKIPLFLENLKNEIDNLIINLNQEEITRAKQLFETSLLMAEEQSAYKSEIIGENFMIFNKYISPEEIIEIILSITKEEIKNCAVNIFSTPSAIILLGIEESKSQEYHQIVSNFNINT